MADSAAELRILVLEAIRKSRLSIPMIARLARVPAATVREWVKNDRCPQPHNARMVLDALTARAAASAGARDGAGGGADDDSKFPPIKLGKSERADYLGPILSSAPLLATIRCSSGAPEWGEAMIEIEKTPRGLFRIRSVDYSLRPMGGPNSMLVVDRTREASVGDLAIAWMRGEGAGAVYRVGYLCRDEHRWFLEHIDPTRQPERTEVPDPAQAYAVVAIQFHPVEAQRA